MAATHIGTYPQKQPDGDTLVQDEMGGGEAVITKIYQASTFTLSMIPPPLSSHPEYPQLKLFTAVTERIPGDQKKLICTYKGVLISNPKVYMVEEASVNTTSEPIETAPIFYDQNAPVSKIKPEEMASIHKALDANTNYLDAKLFAKATDAGKMLYTKLRLGITNWLRSGTQYTQTYLQATIPTNYDGIGTIEEPRGGSPPRPPKGQNYLYTGLSWRKEGGRVTINKEYLLSGRQGWDKDIYGRSNSTKSDGLTTGSLTSGSI